MGYTVKVVTKHGNEEDEKSTLLEKLPGLTINDQRSIIVKMVEIVKKKGKRENWMTGLEAKSASLKEQYWSFIKEGLISEEEFAYFRNLVPKGLYGTTSITEIILADVDNWVNRLR